MGVRAVIDFISSLLPSKDAAEHICLTVSKLNLSLFQSFLFYIMFFEVDEGKPRNQKAESGVTDLGEGRRSSVEKQEDENGHL